MEEYLYWKYKNGVTDSMEAIVKWRGLKSQAPLYM